METREEILRYCDTIAKKNEEIQTSNVHVLIKRLAQATADRADRIREISKIEKYKLYFNGKVGIGKSTLISVILNLINEEKLEAGNPINEALILKVGSGRTTLCETQIIPNADKTEISIEAVEKHEFAKILSDFCRIIKKESEVDLSEEQSTFIKNMAKIELSKSNDEILEEIGKDRLEDVLTEKINYENRNKVTFTFEGNNSVEWLKKNLTDINDGKNEDAPMPSKITIKLSKDDMEISIPNYIESIVDTRGLDGGERPDIQSYINADDSISFMCDEINGYGGNVEINSILKQTLIEEDRDKKLRVVLLGLEKDDDLDNITNFEGNRKGGEKKKKGEAEAALKKEKIEFEKKNLYFISSLSGIEFRKHKIESVNTEILEATQTRFMMWIEELINNMLQKYLDEILEKRKLLNELEAGDVMESTMHKIYSLREEVERIITEAEGEIRDIVNRFKMSVEAENHCAIRGAVNHCGIGTSVNIYGNFQFCAGEEFKERNENRKVEVLTYIKSYFKNCDGLEQICVDTIIEKVNELYGIYYNGLREFTYQETIDKLYNGDSWRKPQMYWGDGRGSYVARVWNDIEDEIRYHKVDEVLNKKYGKVEFLKKIADFLNV